MTFLRRPYAALTVASLLCLLGCESATTEDPRTSPGTRTGDETNEPHRRPTFFQRRGIIDGTTNTDTFGLQTFRVFWDGRHLGREKQSALLDGRIYFLDASGQRIDGIVEGPKRSKEFAADPEYYQIRATSPLPADAWNWLVVDIDDELSVFRSEEELARQKNDNRWTSPFYTGSALQVVYAYRPNKPRVVDLTLWFSEEVDKAQLDAKTLVRADDKPIGACILRGGDCMDDKPFMGTTADIAFTEDFKDEDLVIALPASVMAQGRTVGEGAEAEGVELSAKNERELVISKDDWIPCAGGAGRCWWFRLDAPEALP